jgi:cell division protein FtsB
MTGFGFGKGPPLTAEHQAVHEIRADETLALRARIAELEAENEELKKAISKPWMGSARAAMEKKND